MTDTQLEEGTGFGSIVAGVMVVLIAVGVVVGFVTDWHPLDYRVSFEPDKPIFVTVTPKPTETPVATETPQPTPTAVVLAPYSGDEAHTAYRSAFQAEHKRLMGEVSMLVWLKVEWENMRAVLPEWDRVRIETCRDVAQFGREWVQGVWPPGPYDASNPLLDAHARLTAAELGAMLACEWLGSLSKNALEWPSSHSVEQVNQMLVTASTNLDYALAGYSLDLYGTR